MVHEGRCFMFVHKVVPSSYDYSHTTFDLLLGIRFINFLAFVF